MSKLKNMAVFSAMLVGVMIYTSPAKSAVCFLPDDDGSCGGGDIEISDGSGSDDNKPEEKCDGFTISAAEYEKMKNCFSFFSCTKSKTKEVVYKQKLRKENTTWSNGICCTGGTTYDSAEGKCCPAGGCTHECDAPKEWSSTLHSCECPKNREENTNHECCPVGEHADGAICCPEKKHNEGGVCKCDSQYNTDKNGNCVLPVEKNCVDINKDYKNKNQVSQCENYEPVKGISAADGQCYKCVDKPLDKCVDIEATPFLDIIEPTVTTVKASGEVKEVNATLECGINPKKAYKYEINIITDYDYIKLPVKRIKPVEYRYKSGSLPGYYYKTNIDGKNVCITDSLCTQYAKEGKYISAYEIFIKDMSVKLDHKVYCCKTDDNFSGDSLSHLYSSCKEALPFSEPQHIDKYTGVYFDPVYVCDKGVKEGTKCKIGSYSCPKDYKLSGDNCVKKECPKGYVLTSDNGKDVCVNPTYTCPTDGKYKYKLSGDKCVCDNDCTYEYTYLTNSITNHIIGGLDEQTLRFGKDGPACNNEGDTLTRYEPCGKYNNSNSYTCGKSGPSCNASEAGKMCYAPLTCSLHYNCERGTKCWDLLSANTSVKHGQGFPAVGTIYNKISNTSASCTTSDNVIKYETLCEGTPESECKKKFTPNGCESNSYSIGSAYNNTLVNVVGDKFGDCGCDTSKGLYETEKECEKANEGASLKCTLFTSRWCYQTCESADMYSTEDACKTNAPKYTECKFDADSHCYVRNKIGWGIHYTHKVEEWNNRKYDCTKQKHENGKSDLLWTSWDVSVINTNNPGAAKDLDGNTYWSINEYKGEVRYPAGEYRICFNYAYSGVTNYIYPNSIHLAKRNGDACNYRLGDNDEQWHPDKNNKKFCSNVSPNAISGSYSACMIATFEDYEEYYVEGSFNSVSGSGYSCKRAGSSPY